MFKDLASSIGIGIVGILLGFFMTNIMVGDIESVSFEMIDTPVTSDLADPDGEIFNAEAINPTVEVCVGTCVEESDESEENEEDEEEDDEEEDTEFEDVEDE